VDGFSRVELLLTVLTTIYKVLQMLAKCSFLQKVSGTAVICILHTWFTTLVWLDCSSRL